MRLRVVVVATDERGYYGALMEGCRRNGLEVVVLGMGHKWRGFAWKFTLMRRYLAGQAHHDDDVIIFLDAYDVLALQPASVVLERFMAFQKPIVVSVEDTRDTDALTKYVRRRVFGRCLKADVCSGAYMGRVCALRRLFDYVCDRFGCRDSGFDAMDDQRILMSVCDDAAFADPLIGHDLVGSIFYTIPQPSSFRVVAATNRFVPDPRKHEVRGGQFFLKETGTSPCFIHGNCNVDMDVLIELYRLPASKDKRRTYLVGAIAHHASFLKEEMAVLFILIVVIVVVWRWQPRNATKRRRRSRL